MSLETSVASILRDNSVGRINFKIESISGRASEKAIYPAAFRIIDARHMLTKRGVTLKWTDCDSLRDPIKAHPAYH